MKTKTISRQRRWQLRQKAAGLCMICSAPAVNAYYCLAHAIYHREYRRSRMGCKARYNCQSFRLEQQLAQQAA